jgi:hypothetical protein
MDRRGERPKATELEIVEGKGAGEPRILPGAAKIDDAKSRIPREMGNWRKRTPRRRRPGSTPPKIPKRMIAAPLGAPFLIQANRNFIFHKRHRAERARTSPSRCESERPIMRALLATLAVAGAIAAGCVTTRAQVMADTRYSVAMMSAADVIRALRCAPPFDCKRQRSKPRRANAAFTVAKAVTM